MHGGDAEMSNADLKTGPRAQALMHHFEGLRLQAYQCPARVWTIGYGNTRYPDGRPVRSGDQITADEARRIFAATLTREFEPGVIRAIGDAATTPAQFGAMVALAYNIGVSAFARSQVARRHVAGNHAGAADAFGSWVRGGGQVLPGLVRRRQAEALLYLNRLAELDQMLGMRW
jgi:GH24 family phage-related lysozyme (muramidase)